ncbi:hypothetical protein COLO4_27765 [Corchorus olitorius]|uniref:Uncharacterized protein n=1 Tax=Corchorus olitorius TaxID=93759 RepID=A0A1R3HP85_9ROSI|nr:hypothetical protein COLO4_27765 [Corchorus olitorius]
MEKTCFKLFVCLLLVMGSWRLRGAEARGPFCCPRMVNCTVVCQGFPSHCDGCNCICGGAADEAAAAAAATINTSPLPIN